MRMGWAGAWAVLLSATAAQAVVTTTNVTWSPYQAGVHPSPNFGSSPTHYATINENAAATDFTYAHFKYTLTTSPDKLQLLSVALDQGSEWFLVNNGDHFNDVNIAGGQFTTLFDDNEFPPPGLERNIPLGQFYLGVRTVYPHFTGPSTVVLEPAFGWLRMNNSGTALTMLSNAVSHNSPGIIVGTTTELPEPGMVSIAAVGVLALLRRRRR